MVFGKSVLILCICFVVFSCKKKAPPVNFHTNYQPLEQGRFVVYDVLEIQHDKLAHPIPDTFRYQIKTLIGQDYTDNLNRTAKEFNRYSRTNTLENWVYKDLWTIVLASNRLELTEENERKIKLVFSPTKSKEWNAHVYTTLDELNCVYKNIHKSYSVGSKSFDSTVTVLQQESINFVDLKRKYEVYAKNVGMIESYFKDLEKTNGDSTNIRIGKEIYYKAIEFGIE